jgi:predicted translin family RNA/ssDNA-binding protein
LKKSKAEGIESSFACREYLDLNDLRNIKARLDAYDAMRENVIKKSRDIQKLSKQGIFSLHGGKIIDARSKLVAASDIAREILPLIVEQPSLRSGAYSNSLEEWAEGQLLLHWMDSKTIPGRRELAEYVGQVHDYLLC